jgi:hypothetical protein
MLAESLQAFTNGAAMTEDTPIPSDELIPDLDPSEDDTDAVAGGATMVELPAVQSQDAASGLPSGKRN